jgi:hypothetical protein
MKYCVEFFDIVEKLDTMCYDYANDYTMKEWLKWTFQILTF